MIESLKNNDLDIFKLFINGNDLLDILNYVLSEPQVFGCKMIESILDYHYTNKMKSSIILKNIINTENNEYINMIISKSLINDDLNTLKLFINNENANDLLERAIKISSIETSIYIMHNFEYNENTVRFKYKYINQKMIDVLAIIAFNKNRTYL